MTRTVSTQSAFKHILFILLYVAPGSAFSPFQSNGLGYIRSRTLSSYLILNAEKKPTTTLKELMKEIKRAPEKYMPKDQKSSKRTRKKVTTPKQQYVYAAQRRVNSTTASTTSTKKGPMLETNTTTASQQAMASLSSSSTSTVLDPNNPLYQARQLGMSTNTIQQQQHNCYDPPVAAIQPHIVGRVQVAQDHTKASSFAYIIEKPPGWAILGAEQKKKTMKPDDTDNIDDENNHENDDGLADERVTNGSSPDEESVLSMVVQDDSGGTGNSVATMEFDKTDMLAVMTPEEIAEFEAEGGFDLLRTSTKAAKTVSTPTIAPSFLKKSADKTTTTGNNRIQPTSSSTSSRASFEPHVRSSIVNWLKEIKAEEGTPIRGGTFWSAVAGATNVDDSGLVVLCPKDKVDNLFIDYAKYVAVVGNGKFLAPKPKGLDTVKNESTEIEIMSKLRRGRGDDSVVTVGVLIAEHFSNCNHVVQQCQEHFQDGIRGDTASNPLDRRAPRRLVHCDAMSVSSLDLDDAAAVESAFLPDDIAVLAERRNNHQFVSGSFLGRAELQENPYTNAYREIDGAGDGFPGWTVDRYDKWLLVHHDEQHPRGPLPSIHDGNTAGVYYLPSNPNRSMMGCADIRPVLLEGKPTSGDNGNNDDNDNMIPIQENGVTYLVSLDKDLSTGIFLDQRPQRAWLTRNCNSQTRVLNCFAHCGAYTIAAACAGASTTSLDLNPKYLDRIPRQLELNGIGDDDDMRNVSTDGPEHHQEQVKPQRRHDTIYGDCFDWLTRLAKRGEKFDLIILDPPSTSIGIKKKRWSVKNNMAELVSLAAPMVKNGGLVWTTTNCATMTPLKFAKLCQQGFQDVGIDAKLERVVPMPSDFLSIGTPRVKNLVWRIP